MYNSHWELENAPFPSGTDPKRFYEGASQREALARLRFVTENHRRLGLLLSESGIGKSLLLKVFAGECLKKNIAVAQVDLLGLNSREFFWQLAAQLHFNIQADDQPQKLFSQLADQFHQNRLLGIPTLLLLDNVDQAGADLVTLLQRLANLSSHDNWLTLVLAANATQAARLGQQLLELVDLRIDIEPWDELDTTGYLQTALVEAGSIRPIFEDQAISDLHQQAQGNPRKINRIADYALLIGSGNNQETIDSATIHAACEATQQSCFA